MLRLLMTLLLATGIVSLCQADYVLIRIMVKPGDAAADPNAPKTPEGQPPMVQVNPGMPTADDYVLGVIEAKRGPVMVKEFRQNFPFLEHKYGRTVEFYDSQEISMQFIPAKVLKSPATQYAERRAAMLKEKANPDKLFELAQWCVQVGLTDRAVEVMGELEKELGAKDAPKPNDKMAAALAAFAKIKPILTGDLPNKTRAEQWQKRLRMSNITTSRHYALVHSSDDPTRDGIDRKLAALEANLKAFYLLFALKGQVLPAPMEKLPVILAADTQQVRKVMVALEVPERLTDGLHGRRENVIVLAPSRLDKAGERFALEAREIAKTHGNTDVLKGQFRPLGKTKEDLEKNNQQILTDARAQIFGLMEVLLRDESDQATATHEGSRQLIIETGLLPGNADIPEWLRAGLASVFEYPKGPFPGKNPTTIRTAFWGGAGGPSWAWRRYFDEMSQEGQLPEPPTEAIFRTLTGGWAERAKQLRVKVPAEGDMTDYQAEADTELARGRCLSWAVNYYLLNERLPEYLTFLRSLGNLPRDIELDQYTFLKMFCEAFKIDTQGLTPQKLDGNLEAYSDFARGMLDSVRRVPLPVVPLKFEEKKIDVKDPNGGVKINPGAG